MTAWTTFHRVNEDLAFFFGLSLNILLLFSIKTIRIRAMRKYNILLFQCCCIDMFQVIITFVVKPTVAFYDKKAFILTNGFLRPIGGWIEVLGIGLWTVSMCLCISSLPVSYVFRYRTVVLNVDISKTFYVTSLIIAFLVSSVYGMFFYKFHYMDSHHLTYLAEAYFPWLANDKDNKVKAVSLCSTVSL